VRLGEEDARARLRRAEHGVFCTVHARRGVDAVPVVFVVGAGHVGIPVDRVKPKASMRLQRERNLEADPRATLLVDHWDRDDWSQLWWVRAELRWRPDPPAGLVAALSDRLARRHAQYRDHPFERILVLELAAISGWAAKSYM
jgi:PPOX class probable F420-dependent enzyme